MSKLRKLTAVLLSITMLVCIFTVPASAADVKTLNNDTKTSAYIGAGKTVTYKFSTSEESDFILELTAEYPWSLVNVVDAESGKIYKPIPDIKYGFSNYDSNLKWQLALWQSDSEPHIFEGTLIYHLPKGTYYLKIKNQSAKEALSSSDYKQWQKDGNVETSGKYTFTASYPEATPESKDESKTVTDVKIRYFVISMKKGTTLTLGTELSGDTTEKVTWATSKKSVATVSSSGKITAKKKGTAIITAIFGKEKYSFKIKVTN